MAGSYMGTEVALEARNPTGWLVEGPCPSALLGAGFLARDNASEAGRFQLSRGVYHLSDPPGAHPSPEEMFSSQFTGSQQDSFPDSSGPCWQQIP